MRVRVPLAEPESHCSDRDNCDDFRVPRFKCWLGPPQPSSCAHLESGSGTPISESEKVAVVQPANFRVGKSRRGSTRRGSTRDSALRTGKVPTSISSLRQVRVEHGVGLRIRPVAGATAAAPSTVTHVVRVAARRRRQQRRQQQQCCGPTVARSMRPSPAAPALVRYAAAEPRR